MFRSRTALLKFQPKEGDLVEVRAKVSLYEGRGDYQLIVDAMRPAGEGALLWLLLSSGSPAKRRPI